MSGNDVATGLCIDVSVRVDRRLVVAPTDISGDAEATAVNEEDISVKKRISELCQ